LLQHVFPPRFVHGRFTQFVAAIKKNGSSRCGNSNQQLLRRRETSLSSVPVNLMPHVTIIETGLVRPRHRERHGSYPQMFERLIRAEDQSVIFDVVSVANGEPLPDPRQLQAVLITGSAASVYDDLDWIAPLEDFVRSAYVNRTPMVGVCFGHQLIAQALGGTVRKSEKGWGIGRHVYDVVPGNGAIEEERIAIACSHQDQVIEVPADAQTILFSSFTPHAGLLYANGATLSVQPHPEFGADYAYALCEAREGHAPKSVVTAAKASLAEPLDSALLGRAITRFLARSVAARHTSERNSQVSSVA
jgi:GMP synthase-like glutamine amidotransferase